MSCRGLIQSMKGDANMCPSGRPQHAHTPIYRLQFYKVDNAV